MSISGIDLIAVAFGAFNVLRLASYFPQIVAVACDRHGATAISFSCWSIWIGANATTALYAWVNLGDLPLAAISAFNAACCTAVLLLAAYKRTAIRCRQTAPHRHEPLRRSLPALPCSRGQTPVVARVVRSWPTYRYERHEMSGLPPADALPGNVATAEAAGRMEIASGPAVVRVGGGSGAAALHGREGASRAHPLG